jgi:glycosyltransferase involved in cell wall biosynthesis
MKKILLVADIRGWVFERHCLEIKKRLSNKYHFGIAYCRGDGNNIPEISESYDLVYVLDPMPILYPPKEKTIIGLRCEWLYAKERGGPSSLYDSRYKNKCKLMHVVNDSQFNVFKPIVDIPLRKVQHGVDESIFDRDKYPVRQGNEKFTVACAGRSASNGNKGFDIVNKVCNKIGIRCISTLYEGKRMAKEEMPLFYSASDAYVCFSETEGLHNPTMEAGAMGLPIISTRCGAAEEIIDGNNGIIISRSENDLEAAFVSLQDESKRKKMGDAMYETIHSKWTWAVKIKEYECMFDEAL